MAVTDYFEDFTLIAISRVPDGYGGTIAQVDALTTFRGGMYQNNSTAAQIAYQQGTKTIATVVTLPNDELEDGDIIRRERDGTVWEIIADSDVAPDMARDAAIRTAQAQKLGFFSPDMAEELLEAIRGAQQKRLEADK